MISYNNRIYIESQKEYNFSVAWYNKNDKLINPKLIMRFDCKQINDIQILRLPVKDANSSEEAKSDAPGKTADAAGLLSTTSSTGGASHKKQLFLVAACGDNYVRFFNL